MTTCIHCKVPYNSNLYYDCPTCCEHEPDADEGYHCLNCGLDCAEDVLSSMIDDAMDRRDDGDY